MFDFIPGDAPYDIPPFARACLERSAEEWKAAHNHPFVQALKEGTLNEDRFRFYQMQDARYLEAFADACSLISTRCVDPDDKQWFIEAGLLALQVERELHKGYGEELGYDMADIASLELTPNNRAYQDHMVARAQQGTLVEAVAAITPCPWLYVDLGHTFLNEFEGSIPDDHRYKEWLQTYADPELNEYMDNILDRLQRFAVVHGDEAHERAKQAFQTSVRYEWMFWDQAWNRQNWPPHTSAED